MFLLIPLGIFFVSLALIVWLVVRKFAYLKKLSPNIIDDSDIAPGGFWKGLFPEASAHFKVAKIRERGTVILAEFEKFLRKLRIVSLRIDTLVSRLIHKVRKTTVYHEEILNKGTETEGEKTLIGAGGERGKSLKEEEQGLIIEIAKDPKNAELYRKLGRVYLKAGEKGDAFESFKKALELNPDDADAKVKLEKLAAKIENKG